MIEEFIGNNTQNKEVWQASSVDIIGGFELVTFFVALRRHTTFEELFG
jgi:hypothetical protein